MERKFQQFDRKAGEWDLNLELTRRSEAICEHIKDRVKLDRNTTEVLDFGCGTGQLAFLLSHQVKHITALDGSKEMICRLRQKIAEHNTGNIDTLCLDIDHEVHTIKNRKFDLIYSTMVLHHLENPEKIIRELKLLLKDDGVLCLVDLDSEDGSFHDFDPFIPHNGFDREYIKGYLVRLGFFAVITHTPFIVNKTGKDNINRKFPLFMALASNSPQAPQEKA